MRTWKLILEYDGTAYRGWQFQPTGATVQGTVEEALERILGGPVRITAAGRTDAGVHAFGQVVSFRAATKNTAAVLQRALNALLPPDIAIRHAEEAPPDFDARRWARGKRYRYRIWCSPVRSAFEARFTWRVPQPLDTEAMRAAALPLVGEHDFTSFRAADCPAKHAVRTLRTLGLTFEEGTPILRVEVEGTAFLKHMVRNLVGTLVEVGRGKRNAGGIPALLAARDRTLAGPTAPPQGLFLVEVTYPEPGERR